MNETCVPDTSAPTGTRDVRGRVYYSRKELAAFEYMYPVLQK